MHGAAAAEAETKAEAVVVDAVPAVLAAVYEIVRWRIRVSSSKDEHWEDQAWRPPYYRQTQSLLQLTFNNRNKETA